MGVRVEQINQAAALWAEGLTAAEIADRLGMVSKAAVNQMATRNRPLFPHRPRSFHGRNGRSDMLAGIDPWSDAEIARAEAAWRDGKGTSEIARLLGRTRNSVAGIMNRHRARFPLRTVSAPRVPAASRKVREKPAETACRPSSRLADLGAPSVSIDLPGAGFQFEHRDKPVFGSRPTPFMALDANQCRWPLVDLHDASGADMPCCGAPIVAGRYCVPHANRAAGPGTKSERNAPRLLLRQGRA